MNNCEKCTDNRPRVGRLAGVTRTMRLAIYEGEGVPTGTPQDLSGLTVVVRVLRDGTTDIFTPGFVIEGESNNVVKFEWPAERQTVGDYTLDVTMTDGSGNINRVDWHGPHGIRLVAHSFQVYGEDAIGVESNEEVGLIGYFTSNGVGMSAYDEWIAQGHTGTEADFIAWLRQPADDAATDAQLTVDTKMAEVDAEMAAIAAQASSDHSRAGTDHGTAASDHTTAAADHLQAQSDHATAVVDSTNAGLDHTRAGEDHDVAAADHTQASSDHTQAASDHTTAAGDHTTAAADHTQAVADHGIAEEDHTQAASDHTTAAGDHTTAAADHTQAVADHAVMAGYDTRLDDVEDEVSQLGQEVNGGNSEIFDTLVFEQGGIATADGSNQSSTTQVRSDFIVTKSLRVTVTNGSVYVYGWNDNTYLSAIGWKTGTNDFEIAGATKYKLAFKLPSGNLTPEGVGDLGASVYVPVRGVVVKCVSQTLNETEKQTARENIGAEEAGRLDHYVLGGYVPMDISDVQERSVSINGSTNKYTISDGTTNKSVSKAISIQPGKSYKVTNVVSDTSYYAVLKDITNVGISGDTPHYATGYSERVNIPANGSDTFVSPVDGNFLFVLVKNGAGNDYEPDVYEYNPGIDSRISTVEENIAELDVRVGNLEGGSENTSSITQVFENIQIPVDVNGYEIPVTFGMNAALKKAAQGSQIKYVAKKAYPTLSDPAGAAAGEKTGFPYSSVKEMAKFIHWHVSERTFMTAINNEYGLFYTEDVANDNSRSDYGYTYHGVNCGPYYGMVCNIFALWCLGYPVPFDTAQFAYLATKGVLVKLNNQTVQNVHICDLVWYEGHTALVTSVKHDEYGNVTEVKITESMGHVKTTTFTATQFETYLHITHDALLYRPTFVYKNTYQPSEFIGVRGEETPSAYDYNDDICFFAGDYAAWKLGDNAWVNYTKGSYTGMKVYKGNTLVNTITLDNDSSVHKINVTSYINGAGNYKACLTDGVNDSDFTYWQMVEATASYSNGVVSFESANGTPWYIQVCSSNGSAYCWYEITQEDIDNGYSTLDLASMVAEQYGTVSGTKYVRVAFKTEYGGVVSDMIQI